VSDWSRFVMDVLCAAAAPRSAARLRWEPCKLLVAHNVPCALFLLPYLVRDALALGGQVLQDALATEVTAVLQGGCTGGDARALASADEAGTAGGAERGFRHRATQAVFSLLDTLQRWHSTSKMPLAPSAPGARSRLISARRTAAEQARE
jgi:hypothetical protein